MADSSDPPADASADPLSPVEPPEPRTSRRRFLQTTAVAAAGLAVGCSGGAAGGPDAGSGGDAGAPLEPDAAQGQDATVRRLPDAGSSQPDAAGGDGGEEADAGEPEPLAVPEDTPGGDGFGLGVASGDVTSSAAILWTRYDGGHPLAVSVWEMDGDRYARRVASAPVAPAEGGFVHHEVRGLSPGARHRYAFFEMDGDAPVARSPIGRFRAALGMLSMEPLVVGAVSCTANGRSKATLERAGERDDLDVFLLLGDTTYNDGETTLEGLRAKWAESLGSPGWRATRRVTSVLSTWDDHEVDNNYDPTTHDLTLFSQTLFESLPLRPHPTVPERIWKSFRWGLTAEIFILDCRSERVPSEDRYISDAQMRWLKEGLRDSPCVFKLIASSVPIGNFPFPQEGDRWEGHPAQRDEILRFVEEEPIGGVLWIGGDFHFASVGKVSPEGEVGASQWEVLAGPGAQTGNPAAWLLGRPQFEWSTTTNNYTTLELDPVGGGITARWHDRNGSVIHTSEIPNG